MYLRSYDGRELHVEYWTVASSSNGPNLVHYNQQQEPTCSSSSKSQAINVQNNNKFSMKAAVRNLSVSRDPTTNLLCLWFIKVKQKEKVLQKLGRKTKQVKDDGRNFSVVSKKTKVNGEYEVDVSFMFIVECLELILWDLRECFQRKNQTKNSLKYNMILIKHEKHCQIDLLQKSISDFNSQSRIVSSVTRMVCSSNKNCCLDVSIDGVKWSRIRYFQISGQWQTHVKLFPIGFPMTGKQ